eukprot:m51a1_g837 hypothetical protein (609) ;mRNA; f:757173-759182
MSAADQAFAQRLQRIGDLGAEYIRENLRSTTKPKDFIDQFQRDNSLSPDIVPDCGHVLKLLELQGVTRRDVHLGVLDSLRAQLLEVIPQLPRQRLDWLLESSFPFIRMPEMGDIPMAVLERHPEIPVKFLRNIAANPDIYKTCSMRIKRQLWTSDPDSLKAEVEGTVGPCIEQPSLAPDHLEWFPERQPPAPSKRREASAVVKSLAAIVGDSAALYASVSRVLRELYVRTSSAVVCALRADLLMSLHEGGVVAVRSDPTHKFVWCLDACVRDNSIDQRHIKELSHHGGPDTIADVAMALTSPYAVSTVLASLLQVCFSIGAARLAASAPTKHSRSSSSASASAQSALQMHTEAGKFLLQLAAVSCMSHEAVAASSSNIWAQAGESAAAIAPSLLPALGSAVIADRRPDQPHPSPESLAALARKNPVCRRAFLYYVVSRAHSRDASSLPALLEAAASLGPAVIEEEPSYAQSLASIALRANADQRVVQAITDHLTSLALGREPGALHAQAVRCVCALAQKPTATPDDVVSRVEQLLRDAHPLAPGPCCVRFAYEMLLDKAQGKVTQENAPFVMAFLAGSSECVEQSPAAPALAAESDSETGKGSSSPVK